MVFSLVFSSEQDVDAVTRGVEKGACDFLIKPIQDDTLRMIWQHVLRVKLRKVEGVVNNGVSEVNNQQERSESAINSSSDDATTHPSQGDEVNANKATAKKPRVKWTPELQKKFDIAVDTVYKRKSKYLHQNCVLILNYLRVNQFLQIVIARLS